MWRARILSFFAMLAAASCGDDSCSDGACAAASSSSSSSGTQSLSLVQRYCGCMQLACHDAYHDTFGPESDEPAALANCLAEAEEVPVAGMPVTEGNFIECRIYHCAEGKDDEAACPGSVGKDTCS
jgi:hypothetical protein